MHVSIYDHKFIHNKIVTEEKDEEDEEEDTDEDEEEPKEACISWKLCILWVRKELPGLFLVWDKTTQAWYELWPWGICQKTVFYQNN